MKIAALLPHVEIFGGVRRYLEIGNEISKRGHTFVLFHPKGEKPVWLEFRGIVQPFSRLGEDDFDVGLCSEYSILSQFDRLRARTKFFYFVLEGHKMEKEAARKDYKFLGNSQGICRRIEKKYGVSCFKASGGVDPDIFYPQEGERPGVERGEFRILAYGRIYRRRKGVRQVIKACEKLRRKFPGLKLIFFDSRVAGEERDSRVLIRTSIPFEFHLNLPQSRMAWLFSQADLFVSAERRAGWSNTTAEAMACRLPVVCTTSGTRDFALHNKTALVVPFPLSFLLSRQMERMIRDESLRRRLAHAGFEKIREFTWSALADSLEKIFEEQRTV